MRRGRLFHPGWIVGLIGLFSLGFVSWDVTPPVRWACRRLGTAPEGWEVTVAQARWTPWRRFEVTDLKLRIPRSGRLHLVKVSFSSVPWTVVKGSLMTQWQFGEIRVDPESWGIRMPIAQEILSAGPVASDGSAVLECQFGRITLQQMILHGRFLRLRAEGYLAQGQRANLTLRGELLRTLLEGMALVEAKQEGVRPWEPFELQVQGVLNHPQLQFRSNFFTFAMNLQAEKQS